MLQCERRSPSRRLRPDNGDGGVHGSSFVSLAFLRSCFPVLSFPAPVSDAVGRDGLDNDFEYDALVLIRCRSQPQDTACAGKRNRLALLDPDAVAG